VKDVFIGSQQFHGIDSLGTGGTFPTDTRHGWFVVFLGSFLKKKERKNLKCSVMFVSYTIEQLATRVYGTEAGDM